ncbi:hypothetical protein ACJMK2_008257, partial [Sinanodonta woodiana]
EIQGYKNNRVKEILTWIAIFLTVGLLRLVFYWMPHWMVMCTHDRCPLNLAEVVLLLDQYEQWFTSRIENVTRDGTKVMVISPAQVIYKKPLSESQDSPLLNNRLPIYQKEEVLPESISFNIYKNSDLIRYFIMKRIKYIWDNNAGRFHKLVGLEDGVSCSYFHQVKGLSYEEQIIRRILYGINSIGIHVTPIITLLFKQVLSPFYIFQVFSCALWFSDEYYYYAGCIVFISFVSVTMTIYETRKMQRALRNTIQSSSIVTVCRGNDEYADISSEDLVPGDVIEIPRNGCIMQCDAVLVTGNCIVNESMLTGIDAGEAVSDIIIRSLDLVTIAVPPALPAALTVGIVFAQRRLKRQLIYCISPRSINVCGTINAVCFDKTGTLTEDGLDMKAVVPTINSKFQTEIFDMSRVPKGPLQVAMATCHSLTIIDGVLSGDPLELIMFDAIGWQLEEPGPEETRFDMICPTIVRPKPPDLVQNTVANDSYKTAAEEIGIVRQFTFSSSLQRMSVIVRKLGGKVFELYTKGAPEMVASLCKPETVPFDFQEILMGYTQHGYRVLAIAYRSLPEKLKYAKVQRIQREQVEKGLEFLGLIVMENRLKPNTTSVIKQLRDANIRTVMVTGDNMLTALSVARECGMVDPEESIILVQAYPPQEGDIRQDAQIEYIKTSSTENTVTASFDKFKETRLKMEHMQHCCFAVTGKSWGVLRQHFPDILPKILYKGTVFARMSPDQKAQLIEHLQDIGYYVGMCGDGANDCGALKAAHAGISLSEAEASVASPFTSKSPNISCVPTVIREGRAALVTSFGIFKYMACYSLTQFVSVLILYLVFGWTGPYHKLVKEPPLVSLISLGPVLSLVLHMFIQTGVQVFYYFNVQQQPWFIKYVDNPDDDYTSHSNAAVFLCSTYQYIILAFVFSKGKPYRNTIFSNPLFLGNLVACLALSVWLTVYPTEPVADFFDFEMFPSIRYRCIILGVAGINFLLSLFLEMFILDSKFITKTCQDFIDKRCCSSDKQSYLTLGEMLKNDPSWPPATTSEAGLAQAFQRLDNAFKSPHSQEDSASLLSFEGSETASLRSTVPNQMTGWRNIKYDNLSAPK